MLSLNSEKIFTKRNFPGYLDQRLTDRAVQISAVGADKLSTDTDKLSKDTDIGRSVSMSAGSSPKVG